MKKVLVVDDNKLALSMASDVLRDAGYQISVRINPIGTGAAVLAEQPDVVLLDVNMPGIPGERILEILRTEVPIDKMPLVLFYSEMSEDDLKKLAERSGADGFVVKAHGKEVLLNTIAKCLRSKSSGA